MDDKVINNLKSESRWLRLLFMIVFYMAAYITGVLILVVVAVQVIHDFIKGRTNERLLEFTASLNMYFYQIIQYISFNTDRKPYPFSDWPEGNKGKAEQPQVKDQQ